MSDAAYMARAIELAGYGLFTTDPNPRVGCVIVRDGEVVGEGYHVKAGGPHAEIHALKQAGEKAKGATAYVTLEPCSHHGKTPPCADALIEAGVSRVVVAMEDPNPLVAGKGIERLRSAGVSIETDYMADTATKLNPGFIKRMVDGRPYIRCKLAMSLDGRTAMASGESKWITGSEARQDVQHLRARASAIMTGIGTVLADNPTMNVRLEGVERQPLRIVLDPHLSIPLDAKILHAPGEVLIVTACDESDYKSQLQATGAEVITIANTKEYIDLHALMDVLNQRDINEVHLETGATLSGAFLKAGLIDELIVYMAPKLMGNNARGLFHTPGLIEMADAIHLEIKDIRAFGKDWRITSSIISEG
jgi:diaminohydroxyphosphoribosylaminopyrimidine deaminase/5-amino-6-(5-phosphoribosylamino)uracil reductase